MSGSEMGGGSSSSSRKGNKSGSHNSDKPKQPRRGPGVAQLEKIREMEEMKRKYNAIQFPIGGIVLPPVPPAPPYFAYSPSHLPHGYSPNLMGMGNMEEGASQPPNQPIRWIPGYGFADSHSYGPPGPSPSPTSYDFLKDREDPESKRGSNWLDLGSSTSSSGQSSGSAEGQDLDLELKL